MYSFDSRYFNNCCDDDIIDTLQIQIYKQKWLILIDSKKREFPYVKVHIKVKFIIASKEIWNGPFRYICILFLLSTCPDWDHSKNTKSWSLSPSFLLHPPENPEKKNKFCPSGKNRTAVTLIPNTVYSYIFDLHWHCTPPPFPWAVIMFLSILRVSETYCKLFSANIDCIRL